MASNAKSASINLKTKKPQCRNTEASGNAISLEERSHARY